MDGLPAGDFSQIAASAETPYAREFVTLSRQEHIQLVWEGRYWKSLHQSAVERLARVEREYRERQQREIHSAAQREEVLRGELAYAHGRVRDLQQRLFGRKSERQWAIDNQQRRGARGLRKRGQQPGAAGHGRRLGGDLPVREEFVTMASPRCAQCGKGLEEFPGTEACEVLEIEVKAGALSKMSPSLATRDRDSSCAGAVDRARPRGGVGVGGGAAG